MSTPSKAKKVNDWSADDLERAAKYMRELDGSKNASAALELARREQDVEIQTMKAKEKEHESHKAQASISLEKVRAEEFRKNKEHQREGEKVCIVWAVPLTASGVEGPVGNLVVLTAWQTHP
jgi:hypothetical protein